MPVTPAETTFGERLVAARRAHGPLCVGIDPHPALLDEWGLGDDVHGLETFAETCVEAFDGVAALVKPQVAFFEAHGAAGIGVLERAIGVLRASGTLVLADAKRGDIGSTMAAYARTWLADGPLGADAVTLSPYLGYGALRPALESARTNGRGVFVLAATSNPEAAGVQQAVVEGRTLAQAVVDAAAETNRGATAGSVGVVIGATRTDIPDPTALNGPILLPGVGTQGGTGAAVRALLPESVWGTAVPAVSRDVLRAGPSVPALRARLAEFQEEFAFLR